jgi:hypothetical protein
MSGNEQITDLSNLSDEDFMKLSPEAIQAEMDKQLEESKKETEEENKDNNQEENNKEVEENTEENKKEDNKETENEENKENKEIKESEEEDESLKENKEEDKQEENKESDKENKTKESDEKNKKEDVNKEAEKLTEINEFYTKLTAPFKADGKEVTIRSADDAIRLMQKGINYSRRMEEIKPLRAQDSMLKAHGINTNEQLSYLIDLHEGKPNAIQKLLKDKKIDPLNINTEEESTYKPSNYSPDPKDTIFQEAIETTLAHPKGSDLIKDINKDWDDTSKEALRDQPSIFENLLVQRDSGVYDKIKAELDYQRTMGYLTQVPFLQAYHQVGDAMQKAGVFSKPKTHSDGMAPLKSKPTLIDTGTRKATNNTKLPAPVIIKTTGKASNNGGTNEPDYSTMSDKDFLKLGVPD